jgi:ABC-2 type transport system ATP-binding protein
MAEPSPAINVLELTKSFPGVLAADRLSFQAQAGEVFGLVGPDGAGKTTTLRMLAGVLTPDSGSASIAGCDVTQHPEGVKAQISYMPQRFGLYEDLTVDENIRFYADVFGIARTEREQRARQLLQVAGMGPFGSRLAGNLSGGMKQKLSLVCALIHRPRVILLDEPTNGVDPVSRRDFWHILYSLLEEGIAIVMSTAYLDEAERCHRVALMHQGRILFCDAPSNLKMKLRGAVVAVASNEPLRLREVLAHAEGILNVVLVASGVHVIVDNAEVRIPELRARITDARVRFDSVEQAVPTIEDLFVAAVQENSNRRQP